MSNGFVTSPHRLAAQLAVRAMHIRDGGACPLTHTHISDSQACFGETTLPPEHGLKRSFGAYHEVRDDGEGLAVD